MSTDPETNAAWRRWRSTFYFALLVGGMLAVAAAGWWNLSRISSGGR
jgi:hypothetical protein